MGYIFITAINRHGVLNQVVCTQAEKADVRGDEIGNQGGGWNLGAFVLLFLPAVSPSPPGL